MHLDPGCRVPAGSFFNLSWADPLLSWVNPKQYLSGVKLECSSLMTDENIKKLGEACTALVERVKGAHGVRLEDAVGEFQKAVGGDLLSELRLGSDYCTQLSSCAWHVAAFNQFTKNMHGRLFGSVAAHGGIDSPWRTMLGPQSQYLAQGAGKLVCLSHHASFLSNAAAWMSRRPMSRLDAGTIIMLSLLMARARESDDARDTERIGEALAVLAAEYLRRPGFVKRLPEDEFGAETVDGAALRASCSGGASSRLSALVDSVVSWRRRVSVSDLVMLAIDGSPEKLERASADFEPKLYGWEAQQVPSPVSNVRLGASCERTQHRTDLLPSRCVEVRLSGKGFPCLVGRSPHGFPAVLIPADQRTMEFLARLYGIELPTPLSPMRGDDDMLWSYVYSPDVLLEAMSQVGRTIEFVGYVEGCQRVTGFIFASWAFSGTHDLAEYLPGVDSTGLFVNEIIFR